MKTIKTRLIAIFTVVILVITGVIGFVAIRIVSNELLEDAHNDLQTVAEIEARYIGSVVNAQLLYLEGIAENIVFQHGEISYEEQVAFLEQEAERAGYECFTFADFEGNAVQLDRSGIELNVSERDYFQRALNGEPNVSDVIISRTTEEPIIIYAVPIDLDGQQTGVFYGVREGAVLSRIANEIPVGETGFAYVVNNEGTIVGDYDIDNVLNQLNIIQEAQKNPEFKERAEFTENQMLLRESGSGGYSFGESNRIVGFAPIEGSPWITVVAVE
ncbi:methyl-accepting chemotaxis protein [Tindallia magadiensis]|uniref:Methyl-accepting chemotaxis protein n=1 Tax=Tindallia magadiensis TaxID=69895 RepID=A0A1I3B3E3_9FIRM|nr:cache domain-containing protein [Tindallia magadiensis]SFH56817.1 methyl-accepting chemotaxis protein [Tindallia magadiensis]